MGWSRRRIFFFKKKRIIQNLAKIFSNVFYILFRILSIFMFYCFVFFDIVLLICHFVNLLHVFKNFVNLFYILSSRCSIDKDIPHTVHLQSNITSLELWIIFPVIFLFLLVWCKPKSDKKIKILLLFLICMTFLFLKNKNSSDFFKKVRTCTISDFFASEFMNICDDFQFLVARMNSTFYSVYKLKYRNLDSFFSFANITFRRYKSKPWT